MNPTPHPLKLLLLPEEKELSLSALPDDSAGMLGSLEPYGGSMLPWLES